MNFRAAHGAVADWGENTCKGTRPREAATNHFLIPPFRGRKKQRPEPQPGTPKFLFPALTCWLSQGNHFYSSDRISLSSKLGSVHLFTSGVLCKWTGKYLKSKYIQVALGLKSDSQEGDERNSTPTQSCYCVSFPSEFSETNTFLKLHGLRADSMKCLGCQPPPGILAQTSSILDLYNWGLAAVSAGGLRAPRALHSCSWAHSVPKHSWHSPGWLCADHRVVVISEHI